MFTQLRSLVQEPVQKGQGLLERARETASETVEHAHALVELFGIELQEYTAVQMRRMVLLALGLLFTFAAYALLNALGCVLLAPVLGWAWALGALLLLNLVPGVILLRAFKRSQPGPVAPATRQELQKDVQCLKILLNDDKRR